MYSTLTEPFDGANYSNNTRRKLPLSSSVSYLSILEKRTTLEHGTFEAKLAEGQTKRKLELFEKSFQYQKQKTKNEWTGITNQQAEMINSI